MPVRLPIWAGLDAAIDARTEAIESLTAYFSPVDWDAEAGYTGSVFESYGLGDSGSDSNRITPEDIVAVSMLSVQVPARAAHRLIVDPPEALTEALEQIDTLADLADQVGPDSGDLISARKAWRAVASMRGMGRTRTSKLLARKRPGLVPVQDRITMTALGEPTVFWEPLRQRLRAGLNDQLIALREEADIPSSITPLRVMDVILWMRFRRSH